MRLQAISTLAVLSLQKTAYANWQKINSLFLQLEEAAYNKTISDDPSLASDRGFVPFIMGFLADIQFYGCWCYLDDTWDIAKGPVQDGLDQECKNLVQNYRCLVLDALDRGETCDPQNQDYTEYNLFGGSGDLINECNTNGNENNENPQCRIDLCIADGQFTLDLFSLMFQTGGIAASQPPYDPNVAHGTNTENPGTFDPSVECNTNQLQGAGRSEKECCGSYPTRFPFKTFNGDKACCGDRTYSTLSLGCCLVGGSDVVVDINDPCTGNTPLVDGDCYDDCVLGFPDLEAPQGVIPNGVNSNIQYCRIVCGNLNFQYAGLKRGNECACGNTYGSHGHLALAQCNTPCTDNNNGDMCGGQCFNSIYHAF